MNRKEVFKEFAGYEDDNSGLKDYGRAMLGFVVTVGVELILAGTNYISRQNNPDSWVTNCVGVAMPLVFVVGALHVFTHLSNAGEHESGSFE